MPIILIGGIIMKDIETMFTTVYVLVDNQYKGIVDNYTRKQQLLQKNM